MSEVLIDDSSLNAIAHSIRRKNGLLRTYKPREMAPAIRAFNDFVPDAHSFTVTVQQSPHQTIRVRKYLDADHHEYTNTFTVSEPYYKLEAVVEADVGYDAGALNYINPITVDRDILISAQPAIESDPEYITHIYVNGSRTRFYDWSHWTMYSDPDCTQGVDRASIRGKVNVHWVDPGYDVTNGSCLFGYDYTFANALINVTEMQQDIDASEFSSLYFAFHDCKELRYVNVENWDVNNCTSFVRCFQGCSQLRQINVSGWGMNSALDCGEMFDGCQYLQSLDLSGWKTPLLLYCGGMFNNCNWLRVLDISEWSTSQIETVFGIPNLDYLIMDKEEIKFPNRIFANNSRTKYLVPSSMVNLYKEHANWQSRASQIDSIDNYTITRYGGQVFVTPNN